MHPRSARIASTLGRCCSHQSSLNKRILHISKRTYAAANTATTKTEPKIFTLKKTVRKSNKPLEDIPELPPLEKWRTAFPDTINARTRVSVRVPETAAALAEAFVPEGSRGRIIIEAFPGPGQLTRALLDLPRERIKKIIVLEHDHSFLRYLRPLEKIDPRVHVVPQGGQVWATYSAIEDMGLLADVERASWDSGVHPQLSFISHLPITISSEQLIAQLFRSIPSRSWLFQYGRVPMHFLLHSFVNQRIMGGAGRSSLMRCKLGIIAQATAELTEAVPYESLQPYGDHFHPTTNATKFTDSRAIGRPFTSLSAIPLEHQVIEEDKVDMWDYCVRRLLVQKATSLDKCLSLLGPGGQSLLDKIAGRDLPEDQKVNPRLSPRELGTREWALIVKAFSEWPFAPIDLGIDHIFTDKESRLSN